MTISIPIKMAFLLIVLAIAGGQQLYAQSAVTATWALTNDQSATLSGAGASAATAAPQALRGLTVATKNAYSDNGQRTAPQGIGGPWTKEAGPAADRFVLYAITPAKGQRLSVSQIQLDLSLEGTNSNSVNVAWATDTTHFTNLAPDFRMPGLAIPVTKTFTMAPVQVPAGTTFYLRVAPWTTGNASGGKFLVSRNVTITGIVSKS